MSVLHSKSTAASNLNRFGSDYSIYSTDMSPHHTQHGLCELPGNTHYPVATFLHTHR